MPKAYSLLGITFRELERIFLGLLGERPPYYLARGFWSGGNRIFWVHVSHVTMVVKAREMMEWTEIFRRRS